VVVFEQYRVILRGVTEPIEGVDLQELREPQAFTIYAADMEAVFIIGQVLAAIYL
jgi:hypothetical protein